MSKLFTWVFSFTLLFNVSAFAEICQAPQPGDPDDSKHFLFGRPDGPETNRLLFTNEQTDDGPIERVYELLYNQETNFADWVAYCVDEEIAALSDFKRSDFSFLVEPNLSGQVRLSTANYTGSHACLHVDRGHLAPWASFQGTGRDGLEQTNFMSNIVPQNTFLNQGVWADLEDAVRALARVGKAVYVITGTYYIDGDEESRLRLVHAPDSRPHRIPSGFWKIVTIIDDSAPVGISTVAFSFKNHLPVVAEVSEEDYPWSTLHGQRISIDDLEILTDFDFFPALDPLNQLGIELTKQDGDFIPSLMDKPTIPNPAFDPCPESDDGGDEPASVVIESVLPKPGSGNSFDEFIRVCNEGEAGIDIGGWHLTDGEGQYAFAENTILEASGESNDCLTVFGSEFNPSGNTHELLLANRFDNVSLVDSDNKIISTCTYSNARNDEIIGCNT